MTTAIRVSIALHVACFALLLVRFAWWPAALAIAVANHAVLFAAAFVPRSRLLGPNLTRLPAAAAARGEVALTFDDGPDPVVTPQVLAILARYRAQASFFCIAERVLAYPELVKTIRAHGHNIENHSAHHSHGFAFFGPRLLEHEVEVAQQTIRSTAGWTPTFFRAPMGIRNPFLASVLAKLGLQYVSWTRRGFDTVARDPRRVLERLIDGLAAGDILVLHDGSSLRATGDTARAPLVLEVLPRLLDEIEARGLRAVSLATGCRRDRS